MGRLHATTPFQIYSLHNLVPTIIVKIRKLRAKLSVFMIGRKQLTDSL